MHLRTLALLSLPRSKHLRFITLVEVDYHSSMKSKRTLQQLVLQLLLLVASLNIAPNLQHLILWLLSQIHPSGLECGMDNCCKSRLCLAFSLLYMGHFHIKDDHSVLSRTQDNPWEFHFPIWSTFRLVDHVHTLSWFAYFPTLNM